MKLILTYIFFFITAVSFSQAETSAEKKLRKKADKLFEKKDYVNALNKYRKLYPKDSSGELSFRIGVSMYHLKDERKQSTSFFERSASTEYPEAWYYLASLYHQQHRFAESNSAVEKYISTGHDEFLEFIPDLKKNNNVAMHMVARPLNVIINNIGSEINSRFPDYVPLLSADGKMMLFTSRRDNSTGRLKDRNGEYMEDIYVSYLKEGKWDKPASLGKQINTDLHDACVALSPDGQQLILFRTSEDLMSGDLYISQFTGKEWSEPVILGSDINTEDGIEASATFSPDNSVLIFSSDRSGGFGGKDLYRVVRLPDGSWSKAVNLGPVVNSAKDEDSPFLHSDGKSLYFSSTGFENMGGYDIFKSEINDEGIYSSPVNLGYPINTVFDDIYFSLSVNGDKGYFSSINEVTHGGTDIYQIDIADQNFGLAVVSCKVRDENGSPVQARVSLENQTDNVTIGKYLSSRQTGKMIMIISPKKNYRATFNAEGFGEKAINFTFDNKDFVENVVNMDVILEKGNNQ